MSRKELVYELFGETAYYWIKKQKKKIRDRDGVDLKQNRKYRDCHKGKRCFILGNGPSLKGVDLSKLQNEIVFTCNNFARVKDYEKAKPNYHLWVDEAFFELRTDNVIEHDELLFNYKAISRLSPECFVPVAGEKYMKEQGLDKILHLNYFDVLEWVDEKKKLLCNLDSYITGFTTVVQYAVIIAIYMGFKEIYLLGCDSTNVIAMLNSIMNIENGPVHAYSNDDSSKRYVNIMEKWSVEKLFADQYTFFLGYRRLREECDKRNIILRNLSEVTLIDSIIRADINNIL